MRRGPELWLSPLVAIAVLVAAATQVAGALGVTGAFGWRAAAVHVAVPRAYLAVDAALDRRDPRLVVDRVSDPFSARSSAAVAAAERRDPRPRLQAGPRKPAPPAEPVLTAIVWDDDPRALVRWRDREWTIRQGGLFDEFEVVSISRDQVSLRRGDATLVLQSRNSGD